MGPLADNVPETVDVLVAAAIADDPAQPLLTWYDDRTGERVELSGVTLGNWVAKTANLLVDGCGLGPGDRAAVLLPPHWQTAAVLLGCWTAGLEVSTALPDAVDVLFVPAAAPTDAAEPTVDRFVLGFAPLGAPTRDVPPGYLDYVAEVRGHGDAFTPYRRIGPGDPARDGPAPLDHRGLCAAARDRAAALRVGPGARVLVDAAAHPDPLDWLLAPLAAGGSVVLCGSLDRAKAVDRAATEKATVILTGGPG